MVWLLNWRLRTLGYAELKKNSDILLPENGFSRFFIFFTSKIFLANISSKIFKHISEDIEFCGEYFNRSEISVKPLLKSFHHFFFFSPSQLDDWIGVHLLNVAPTINVILKNKDGSFVEQKILYRMSLERSLEYVRKCSQKRETFCPVLYGSFVI
jgi:hypothetical protein